MNEQEQLKKIEEIRKDLEKILNKTIQFEVNFERADDPTGDLVDKDALLKELVNYITKTTPHLISSDEIKREAEYQNVLDFVTWVILNKNDLEVAHDFDEYCKKKNLTQSKEGGE